METKHTPTPYYVSKDSGGYSIRVSSVVLGKPVHYDVSVAVLSCDPLTADQSKETAEFIVRACNCHDEMREALRECRALLELAMGAEENPFGARWNDATDATGNAAIILAKATL